MWGVWATVSGGVTGHREAWLKDDGTRVEFDTREEAEEAADRMRRLQHMPTRHGARFTYTPRRIG